MKVLRSKLPDVRLTVPLLGGYLVLFSGHRAAVPDEVADYLLGLSPGFYSLVGDLSELVRREGASVLVIRDTGMGDVLLCTPLIRALAAVGCSVDVLTHERYRCLFEGNPCVRATYPLEADHTAAAPCRANYTAVLDLRLVVENAERAGRHHHRADAFASFADVTLTPEARHLDYFPTEEELAAGRQMVCLDVPSRGTLAYVLRASNRARSWSAAKHQAAIDRLVRDGWHVFVLDHERHDVRLSGDDLLDIAEAGGAPRGCRVSHAAVVSDPAGTKFDGSGEYLGHLGYLGCLVNTTGALSLREVAGVMAACDAVLTPDTGLFHLAGALDKPTVSYFGAMDPDERAAHRQLTVLNCAENCPKLPCRSGLCLNFDANYQPRCLDLDPARVAAALEALVPEKGEQPCQTEPQEPTNRPASSGKTSRKR